METRQVQVVILCRWLRARTSLQGTLLNAHVEAAHLHVSTVSVQSRDLTCCSQTLDPYRISNRQGTRHVRLLGKNARLHRGHSIFLFC
jgi:hypothetical protein